LIALGDSAAIRIDAFRNRVFVGRVTEIGNSAINPPGEQQAGQQAAIDFEVVLTLEQSDAPLRPDLSATADVVVESRTDALAVPIIAMTVRDRDATEEGEEGEGEEEEDEGQGGQMGDGEGSGRSGQETEGTSRGGSTDVEGVFLVRNGTVTFVPVEIGIAGQEYFEILSGLSEGDSVVAGPYQRIRQLRDGDAIRSTSGPVVNGND
jgi:HlyD family secretion protein